MEDIMNQQTFPKPNMRVVFPPDRLTFSQRLNAKQREMTIVKTNNISSTTEVLFIFLSLALSQRDMK